jgi:hypothetical protein
LAGVARNGDTHGAAYLDRLEACGEGLGKVGTGILVLEGGYSGHLPIRVLKVGARTAGSNYIV